MHATVGEHTILWNYDAPIGHPKKVSLWVNLREVSDGDHIDIHILYDADGDGFPDFLQDSATRKFRWVFVDDQVKYGVLMIDELPVASKLKVDVYHHAGTSLTLFYQAIIEEL